MKSHAGQDQPSLTYVRVSQRSPVHIQTAELPRKVLGGIILHVLPAMKFTTNQQWFAKIPVGFSADISTITG